MSVKMDENRNLYKGNFFFCVLEDDKLFCGVVGFFLYLGYEKDNNNVKMGSL